MAIACALIKPRGMGVCLGDLINTCLSFLLISIGLAFTSAILKPLGEGLFDTSMWVAKILAPNDAEENDATKQLLRFNQAALMEGWLSNVPFIASIFGFTSMVTGFIYHWWAGVLMYLTVVTLGATTKRLFGRSVSYYLVFLYHKMVNRTADYKMHGDATRLEASESLCKDLERIIAVYQNSELKPPTLRELKAIPYGDLYYWLRCERDFRS